MGTIKKLKVEGNTDVGCRTACNGNSSCGGDCGGQCYKQVFTDSGVDTILGYECRGVKETVSPLPITLPVRRPATQAAFVDQTGSPQFDAFEGGKFDPYAYAGPNDPYQISFGVPQINCRCHPNTGCANCSSGLTCWSIQETIRTNNGKPGTLTPVQYFCADTEAQLVRYYNTKKYNRTKGTPNLFNNFPIATIE